MRFLYVFMLKILFYSFLAAKMTNNVKKRECEGEKK